MMTRQHRFFLACAAAPVVFACTRHDKSLYPLDPGVRRQYEMRLERGETTGSIPMVITSMPTRELNGKQVVPLKIEVNGTTTFSFIGYDDNGFYIAATQSAEDASPSIKATPEYFLRLPVTVGTAWDTATKTQLQSSPVQVTLHSVVEAVDETVTIPAGSFERCSRVVTSGAGIAHDQASVTVNGADWYCPGVGWVKSILKEGVKDWAFDASVSVQLTALPAKS